MKSDRSPSLARKNHPAHSARGDAKRLIAYLGESDLFDAVGTHIDK